MTLAHFVYPSQYEQHRALKRCIRHTSGRYLQSSPGVMYWLGTTSRCCAISSTSILGCYTWCFTWRSIWFNLAKSHVANVNVRRALDINCKVELVEHFLSVPFHCSWVEPYIPSNQQNKASRLSRWQAQQNLLLRFCPNSAEPTISFCMSFLISLSVSECFRMMLCFNRFTLWKAQ